jgi:ABC-type spermidine/putrescine transport system permease subunit I|tara:strand:+ start:131 stop:397 length:267 start_codon:yes stop_codon:yes gene_type:complete
MSRTANRSTSSFLDAAESDLVRTVMISALVGFVVLAVGIGLVYGLLAPGHDWESSAAVGVLVAFWMAALVGGVVGNGIHEARRERHRG